LSQGGNLSGIAWALVGDLFLRARVEGLVRAAGLTPRFFATPAELTAALARAAGPDAAEPAPVLLVIDLSDRDGRGFRALESLPERRPKVLAFYSHVEAETRARALSLGADRVVPRSAFVLKFASFAHELIGSASP
jgi:DNA-binding NarL/FixJ family response regulator